MRARNEARLLAAAMLALLAPWRAQAETVLGEVFLKGERLEVGLAGGGTLGTLLQAPAGFHPAGLPLGLVADTGGDGWTIGSPAQSGDYLPPVLGEAWAVKWGATVRTNVAGLVPGIPKLALVETSSGGERSAVWEGIAVGGVGESLRVVQTFAFDTPGHTLRVHVQLTNTGSQVLPGVKYMRGLNPDPDVDLAGNGSTSNAVWLQPGATTPDRALVVGQSMLGFSFALVAADSRARVSVEDAMPQDPDDVLDSPSAPDPSAPSQGDETLAIAFALGDLQPGETTAFELAYATDADSSEQAVEDLAALRIVSPGGELSGDQVSLLVAADPAETLWVDLLQNGLPLGTDAEPSAGGVYGVAFTPAAGAGSAYATLDAVSHRRDGHTVSERITLSLANDGPPVAFVAPSNGQNVSDGTAIRVEASDPGHPPTRAEVFVDSPSRHAFLGSCESFPCDLQLWGVAADETVALSARALDALQRVEVARVTVSSAANEAPGTLLYAPNGGSLWAGAPTAVRWASWDDTLVDTIDIEYSTDGGLTWLAAAGCTSLSGTTTSCVWTPPAGSVTATGRVRVVATDPNGASGADLSDGSLRILSPGLVSFTAPKTPVSWRIGSTQTLSWAHNLGAGSSVRIEINRAFPEGAWETLAASWPNASASKGSYSWSVAGATTSRARFRVSDAGVSGGSGTSPANVTLAEAWITVAEVKSWLIGSSYVIKFNHNLGKGQPVRIELWRGSGWQTLFASVNTTGAANSSHAWVAGGPAVASARLRVTALAGGASDESNAGFAIK